MSQKMAHSAAKSRRLSVPLRLALAAGAVVVLAGVAVVVLLIVAKPSVSVAKGGSSLFEVHVGGLGANLQAVDATAGGKDLTVHLSSTGGYVPASDLAQGQTVEVTASVKSPSWISWLVGSSASTTTVVHTPAAKPSTDVAIASSAGQVQVSFDHPVSVVSYKVGDGEAKTVHLSVPSRTASLEVPSGLAGYLSVTAAPEDWEKTAQEATKITWFAPPVGSSPVALVTPSPNSDTADIDTPISITFDKPVSEVLGSTKPTLSPSVPGTWSEPSADTLVFTPSGFGYGPEADETVTFDRSVSVVGGTSDAATTTSDSTAKSFSFNTAAGSVTRLEEILADLHYLPLDFVPSAGASEPATMAGQIAAIDNPVSGSFEWRWSSTPSTLESFWSAGSDNVMLKGALMAFEAATLPDYDGYDYPGETVDDIATASTWKALIQADLAGKTDPYPYAYAYVTKTLPESLTLWENGKTVLTSAANTGIAQDPTADGTFPVYLRFTENWMNGTNPDGSTYHDLVHWISYFNGSDAVHAFPRSSYGFPQSLGCVELPAAAGETAFNDMAIGDLVTVTG